jgi:hypothetical protein
VSVIATVPDLLCILYIYISIICISQQSIRSGDIHRDTKEKEEAVAVMESNVRIIVSTMHRHIPGRCPSCAAGGHEVPATVPEYLR